MRSGEPGSGGTWMEGMQMTAEAQDVVEDHGFTGERFAIVGSSVAQALAASEMKKNEAEFAEAKKQLAQMKSMMDPNQYVYVEKQMLGAQRLVDRQPPGNIVLVDKHRRELGIDE